MLLEHLHQRRPHLLQVDGLRHHEQVHLPPSFPGTGTWTGTIGPTGPVRMRPTQAIHHTDGRAGAQLVAPYRHPQLVSRSPLPPPPLQVRGLPHTPDRVGQPRPLQDPSQHLKTFPPAYKPQLNSHNAGRYPRRSEPRKELRDLGEVSFDGFAVRGEPVPACTQFFAEDQRRPDQSIHLQRER